MHQCLGLTFAGSLERYPLPAEREVSCVLASEDLADSSRSVSWRIIPINRATVRFCGRFKV